MKQHQSTNHWNIITACRKSDIPCQADRSISQLPAGGLDGILNKQRKNSRLFLQMKVRHCDGSGTCVGSDGGADGADGKLVCFPFPECRAVRNILLQERVVQAGIAEAVGHGEIDAAALVYLLNQHIVAVLGAACLAENGNLPFDYGDNGLDRENCSCPGSGLGNPAALL